MSLNMTLNISLNSSELEYLENELDNSRRREEMTLLALCGLSLFICLLGLVGNGIMIWLFTFNIKRNQATVYFLNLAIADFLYLAGLCICCSYIICVLNGVNIPKSYDAIIGKTSLILHHIGFDASSFLLAAISVERCVLVLFPLHIALGPKYRSTIVCASLWVLAILIMALEGFVCLYNTDDLTPGTDGCVPIHTFTTVLFAIVVLFMIFSTIVLIAEIQKTSKFCRPPKLYIVVLLTLLIFLISVVPARVFNVLILFHVYTFMKHMTFLFIHFICTGVYCTANPYINILVGRWGKVRPIKKALERVFHGET